MSKLVSAIGFLAVVAGLAGLVIGRHVLSPMPVVIVLQLAAIGLMV